SGSVHFDLTWKEKNLDKIYGREPRDIAKLAADVYRALEDGRLFPKQFIVHAPPAPPTDLVAIDTEPDSITIAWERPEHFEIEFYHVQIWHTSSNMSRNVSMVSGKRKSVTLGNLESETTYNLTMFSENRYGVGQRKSNVLQVETMK
ncbi:phosphatidylinositol phosphatase PTPRQ, partial [Paramuricea clavata]